MKRLFVVLILFLYSTILWSQDQIQYLSDTIIKRTHTLADVEVVAAKEKQDVFKLPMRSTSIESDVIEQQNIPNIRALSALVPNLFMPDYGSKLTAPIYIRGVGSRINSPSVGLYVDGVPYFEKSAFDFALLDIESIEVLSGPQATLYGRNTMGGIIQVRSRLPQPLRQTRIQLNAANYDNLSLSAEHHQPISPKVQMNVAALWKQGHYQLKNTYDDSFVDKQQNAVGRMKWLINPTQSWRIVLSSQYDQSAQKGYPYALYNDKENIIQAINYNQESHYNRKLLSNSMLNSFEFDKFSIESVTAHQYMSDNQKVDQDFMPFDMFVAEQAQSMNVISQEVYLKSKGDENAKHEWISGVFAFYQQMDKEVNVNYGTDAVNIMHLAAQIYYLKSFENANSAWAIFHQSTFNNFLIKGLSLDLGLRYDQEYSHLDFGQYTFLTASAMQIKEHVFDSRLSFSQWIPKAGLSYHLSPLAYSYFSLSKGYKTGGFNTSFARERDRTYAPEYSWNYEWGIKAKLWQQRLHTALSLFYIDWRDQQVYQPVYDEQGQVQPGSLLQNAAKAQSKGIELSASAFVNKHWQFNSRFGYTDAKYVEYTKGKDNYNGNKLPYIPAFTFYLDAHYGIAINKSYLQSLTAILSYNGFGKHYWREDNIAHQNYYALLNASILFSQARWQMSIWAKNILNAHYNAFYFRAIGHSCAQAGRPLMLGIKLAVQL